MRNLYKTIGAMLLASFTIYVQAENLTVICDIKQKSENQPQSTYKRRLEMELEPRFFKTSIDTGNGFVKSEEGFPKDVDSSRIVLSEDAAVSRYYDRKSSYYVYKDAVSGAEATGPCSPEKR